MRGPAVPRVPGQPELRTARERFDDLALGIVTEVGPLAGTSWAWWSAPSRTPPAPRRLDPGTVPLSSLVRGTGSNRPGWCSSAVIEHRCDTREDLEGHGALVVVEQAAELLGIEAEEVDPRLSAATDAGGVQPGRLTRTVTGEVAGLPRVAQSAGAPLTATAGRARPPAPGRWGGARSAGTAAPWPATGTAPATVLRHGKTVSAPFASGSFSLEAPRSGAGRRCR